MSGNPQPSGALYPAQGIPSTTDVKSEVRIAGVLVPVNMFEATSGTYGSVGHAMFTMSRALLDELGIDLVTVSSSSTVVPVTIYVTDTGPLGTGVLKLLFAGSVVSTEWDIDDDVVTVHARDRAGVFIDQKRILVRDVKPLTAAIAPLSPGQKLTSQGIATTNRLVSQVVRDVATEFGYTAVINMGAGTDVMAGSSLGSGDHTLMTIPMNLWTLLNTMARDTGNEVYTTADGKLVFGTPGAGLQTLHLTWRIPESWPNQTPGSLPAANLKIVHNPRRNGTFRVLMISYDQARAQTTIGRATYIGSNLATPGLSEGLYVGTAAQSADARLVKDASTKGVGSPADLSHVQLYTFHWDGMGNDDANARAAAVATDISKRLMTMCGVIDGYTSITPTQPIILHSTLPRVFTGNTWYVSGYRHRFVLPHGSSGHRMRSWEGFTTEFQALDLPSVSLAGAT